MEQPQIPVMQGKIALQAHVQIPDGTVEEEYARQGFFGRYSHLYRSEAPVGWTRIEGPLKPRAIDPTQLLKSPGASAASAAGIFGRKSLLENADLKVFVQSLEDPEPFASRNADSDELFFVHQGSGHLQTDFGSFTYEEGDYITMPRGTVFRWIPWAKSFILGIESNSEIGLPDKGMLGQHAFFDPAVIQPPRLEGHFEASLDLQPTRGEFELQVKREGELTRVFYPFNPFNTIGWKGTLYPWKLNVRDIRPISCDRYHLPPSAHTTFVAHNFVVCTFLPRPLENGDPKALKVPFYHSNIDYDEVLFYHAGDFFSREGIKPGMMTFHPQGIHHGPQPKAILRTPNLDRTNEIAVMIDTRNPLKMTSWAKECENQDYWGSWKTDRQGGPSK